MRLGILMTGRVNETLVEEFSEYDEIFTRLYQAVDPSIETVSWPVLEGVFPQEPHDADAWLVTGSKHGVYDDLPWIPPLKDFLRSVRGAGVPMIGICFGHQIMAEAFGGSAVKYEGGWGVGVHRYEMSQAPGWIDAPPEDFAMHAFHQDQVVALPADARVLASSAFCENAMVSYGDPEVPDAISIQPHPEFSAGYAKALLDLRSGIAIPENVAAQAWNTADNAHDGLAFARWSLAYLQRALSRRRAA